MYILTLISDVLLFSLAIPLVLFIYYYARYSNWREFGEGRTLMSLTTAFLATVIFLDVSVIFTRMEGSLEAELFPGQSVLRAVVYTGLTIAFWRLFSNLKKAQKATLKN